MKLSYYRLSLKKRIPMLYILLTVFCITLTGMLSYYFASKVMKKNALDMSQNTLSKSVQVLDEHLRHIVVSSYSLMLSEAYDNMAKDVISKNHNNFYKDLTALQAPFAQMKLNEPSIESALLSTPIGDFFSTKDTRSVHKSFTDVLAKEITRNSWNSLWIEAHEDELFSGKKRVLSLVLRPLSNYYLPDVYLNVNLNEQYMKEILEQNLINDQVRLFLLNKDGSQVIRPSSQVFPFNEESDFLNGIRQGNKGNFEYVNDQGNNLLVNYANLTMNNDWVLVSIQSKADLLRPMQNIRWLILYIMIGCMIVALFFSNLLSSVLLKPLYKLQSLMLRVEQNDLEVRFGSKYEDEVGQVGHKFNRMLEQIQTLIEEVKASEKEKRKSEVKALQAQVDPHFLYNTLNTIYWKIESEEYEDVKEMIVSVSLLFRLGLNNGNETTTLDKEIEHVKQYLNIQQKCYEDRFTYSFYVENPNLLQLPILKILLQPLVENSILHGFRDYSGAGEIRVEIYEQSTNLIMRVIDNGCGMDTAAVNQQIEEHHLTWKSYALTNVRSRLQLYYGDRASLHLQSIPYTETIVKVSIPLQQEVLEWRKP